MKSVLLAVFLTMMVGCSEDTVPVKMDSVSMLEIDLPASPHLFIPINVVFTGENNREILRVESDGKVFYMDRLLGTDSEIFEGLRKATSNEFGICLSPTPINSGFYHIEGESHDLWHFAVAGQDAECFKEVHIGAEIYWQRSDLCKKAE